MAINEGESMALVTCPVCGRRDVSDSGDCPNCRIPVGAYRKAMSHFKDPAEGDTITCSECGSVFEPGANQSCPNCGKRLPNTNLPTVMNPECPKCRSRRTEEYDCDIQERGFLETLFSRNTSIYFIKSYWCHNCGHTFKKKVG